jgi:hypothetical protein
MGKAGAKQIPKLTVRKEAYPDYDLRVETPKEASCGASSRHDGDHQAHRRPS